MRARPITGSAKNQVLGGWNGGAGGSAGAMGGCINAGTPCTNEVTRNSSANFGTAEAAGAQYPMLVHALRSPRPGEASVPVAACS